MATEIPVQGMATEIPVQSMAAEIPVQSTVAKSPKTELSMKRKSFTRINPEPSFLQ